MVDQFISAKDEKGNLILRGLVLLVYTDALISGTNEYVSITMLSVKNLDTGVIHNVRPRDVICALNFKSTLTPIDHEN